MTDYTEHQKHQHWQRRLDYYNEASIYQRTVIEEARDNDAPRTLIVSYLKKLANVELFIEFYEELLDEIE